MLTLDTSGIIALMNPTDRHHRDVVGAIQVDGGPYYVPMGIMAEIAYLLEARAGQRVLLRFLHEIARGGLTLDCDEDDLDRITMLVERYADLGLGFADAAVIACAERHRGRVITLDRRHFPVVARGEGTITVLPAE
jgi:predicted nucleic acid-binding protein